MKLSHTLTRTSAVFDDPNLVSSAGLVPVMALSDAAGLRTLTDERLTVATDKGANAGLKVASIIGGMLAGADSIDDMAVLRHGGMGKVFSSAYAPSTLGSFLRAFTFGHVRQLDAVAARFLLALAASTRLLTGPAAQQGIGTAPATGEYALLDVDDTIIEVHGHQKQGAGFGYSKVRGLNAFLATLTTAGHAPVIVAQRLRKGSCGSPRGAARLIADAVKQARRLLGPHRPVLVRMDSAFFGGPAVRATLAGGADVSVTVRLTATIKAAIAGIDEHAWTTIEYTDAIRDEATGAWISRAEVAEIPFTAFAAQKTAHHVPG
ncbi:MAG TPA: IS1380 family transposase, partial [Intrasporangium sp.]|uniref:IS1380 family transposase n=1 Tax=Intrasporangium sp. TaxID=1925024 RepID=UPI002D79F6F2